MHLSLIFDRSFHICSSEKWETIGILKIAARQETPFESHMLQSGRRRRTVSSDRMGFTLQ